MKETTYLSAKEAAKKWNLTMRRVQQLCKSGQIPGAEKFGNSWMIPADTPKPERGNAERENVENKNIGQYGNPQGKRIFMPLTSGAFTPGMCREYIEGLEEGEEKQLAWAEYCYFSGQAQAATSHAEEYLHSQEVAVKLTASILFGFANLSLGQIHRARFALNNIRETLNEQIAGTQDRWTKAVCVCAATMGCVLLHLPMDQIPPLKEYVRELQGGLKVFACYLLSHQAYLEGKYERALTIAENTLLLQTETYPVSFLYIHLMAAISAMNLKEPELAARHFREAWELARPDDLIEAFGEHHGLLQGLIESCLSKEYPKDYERVINITYSFSAGWRKIHNPDTNREVADDLTTMEFTVAMLADRNWTRQEIADHMGISVKSVVNHLTEVYQKLGVEGKRDLHSYLLY